MFRLGHVVLNVSSHERSVPFYESALGLQAVGRLGDIVFLTFGESHHDVALREVPGADVFSDEAIGLRHVAFRIGSTLEQLHACRSRIEAAGIEIVRARDHRVSQSLYFRDPDGIAIEVYIDDPDKAAWRDDPAAIAHSEPLELPSGRKSGPTS